MARSSDLDYSHLPLFNYPVSSAWLDASLALFPVPRVDRRVIPSSPTPPGTAAGAGSGRLGTVPLPPTTRHSVRYVRPTSRERQERLCAYYTAKRLIARGAAARKEEEDTLMRSTLRGSTGGAKRNTRMMPPRESVTLPSPSRRALREVEDRMLRQLGVLVEEYERQYDRAGSSVGTRTFPVSPMRPVAPSPDMQTVRMCEEQFSPLESPTPRLCEANAGFSMPLALPCISLPGKGQSARLRQEDILEDSSEECKLRAEAVNRHVQLAIANLVAASRPMPSSAAQGGAGTSAFEELTGVSETLLDQKAETTPAEHVKLLVRYLEQEPEVQKCAIAAARLATYVLMRSLPTELYEGDPIDYRALRRKKYEKKTPATEKLPPSTAFAEETTTRATCTTGHTPATTNTSKRIGTARGKSSAITPQTAKTGTSAENNTSGYEKYYLHQDAMTLTQTLQCIALRKGFWLSSTVPMMRRPPMHACGLPLRAAREIALWQRPPVTQGKEYKTSTNINSLGNTQHKPEELIFDFSLALPVNPDHKDDGNDKDGDKNVLQISAAEAAPAAPPAPSHAGLYRNSMPRCFSSNPKERSKLTPTRIDRITDSSGFFDSCSDYGIDDDYDLADDDGGPNLRPRVLAPLLVISNGGYGVAPFSTKRSVDNVLSLFSMAEAGVNVETNDTIFSAMNNIMHPEPGLLPLHPIMHGIYRSVQENRPLRMGDVADDISPAIVELLMDFARSFEDIFQSLLRKSVEKRSHQSFFTHTYRETLLSWSAIVVCEAAIGYAAERAGCGPANFCWTSDDVSMGFSDEQLEEIAQSGLVERTFPQMGHWAYDEKLFRQTVERLRSVVIEAIGRVKGELYFLVTGVDNRVAVLDQYCKRLLERNDGRSAFNSHAEESPSQVLRSDSSMAQLQTQSFSLGRIVSAPDMRSLQKITSLADMDTLLESAGATAISKTLGAQKTKMEASVTQASGAEMTQSLHSPLSSARRGADASSNSSSSSNSTEDHCEVNNSLRPYNVEPNLGNASHSARGASRRRGPDDLSVGFRVTVPDLNQCLETNVATDAPLQLTNGTRSVTPSNTRHTTESPMPISSYTSPYMGDTHAQTQSLRNTQHSPPSGGASPTRGLSMRPSFRRPRTEHMQARVSPPSAPLPEDLTVRRVRHELVALKFQRRGAPGTPQAPLASQSQLPAAAASRAQSPSALMLSVSSRVSMGNADTGEYTLPGAASSALATTRKETETAAGTEASPGRALQRAKEEMTLAKIVGDKQAASVARLRSACENTAQFYLHRRDPTRDDGTGEGDAAGTEWYSTGKAGFSEQRTLACIKRSRQVVAFDLRYISPLTALAVSVDRRCREGMREALIMKELRLGESMVPWTL